MRISAFCEIKTTKGRFQGIEIFDCGRFQAFVHYERGIYPPRQNEVHEPLVVPGVGCSKCREVFGFMFRQNQDW
jgi:hypothetical protein